MVNLKPRIHFKKHENRFTRKLQDLSARYGLPFGIFVAVVVAIFLTFVSMMLYFISGTSKLDLSRPGYESARQQINRDGENDRTFPSTGPINTSVISDFEKRYDEEVKELGHYDDFSQDTLGDEQIGLTDDPIAPTDGASTQ